MISLHERPRLFRCKIQRRSDGYRMSYMGPFGEWPKEFSIVMWRPAAARAQA